MKSACAAALLTAAVTLASCSPAEEPPAKTSSEVSHAMVTTLARTSIADFYDATGTVEARTKTTVSAKIVGNVAAVSIREGDSVRAGQLLLEIDSRDLAVQTRQAEAGVREAMAALEEVDHAISGGESGKAAAEANLRLASSTLERFTVLRDRKSVSPHEFEEVASREESARAELTRAQAMLEAQRAKRVQIQARIDQARSQVEASTIALGYARILSPMDGVVSAKLVDTGAQAAPGVPLVTIESRDYEIHVAVPESSMGIVRQGTRVQVAVSAAGLDDAPGVVTAIVPDVDAATRSFTAKVSLSRAPAALRSGMFARVRVPTGKREAIAIPVTAMVDRGQLTGVYVVEESNVIRLRLIRTGQRDGDEVEVLSGLGPGDRIFPRPDSTVKDGARWQP